MEEEEGRAGGGEGRGSDSGSDALRGVCLVADIAPIRMFLQPFPSSSSHVARGVNASRLRVPWSMTL